MGQGSRLHADDFFRMIAETQILPVVLRQENRLQEILLADVKPVGNHGISQIRRMFNGWKQ